MRAVCQSCWARNWREAQSMTVELEEFLLLWQGQKKPLWLRADGCCPNCGTALMDLSDMRSERQRITDALVEDIVAIYR